MSNPESKGVNHAEPSNNRENRRPRDPPIGPQNRPNPEQGARNQERVFMTPDEISELVQRPVQRATKKRPVQEPSRDISYHEAIRGRPRERVPREGQGERRMKRSLDHEGESRPALFQGQKRAHDKLSEQVDGLQREVREVWRNIGQAPRRTRGLTYAENIVVEELPASF